MTAPLTVGVLYAGELGAALAAALVSRGVRVVTTARGRSPATAARAAASGAVVLDTLPDVVRAADVLFSLVLPSAAGDMAERYLQSARLAPRGAVYVDVNSIGPETARAIAGRIESAGVSFVDASINGLAKNLCTTATLYLSGRRAADVAALCDPFLRAKPLGDEVGRASAMKMLLGGLSKGVCALFAELAVLAHEQGMLDALLEATTGTYPGITALAERMLPTYARHAARRAIEMNELAATATAAGVTPRAIDGVVRFHRALAEAMAEEPPPGAPGLISRMPDVKSGAPSGEAPPPAAADLPATVRLFADRLTERDVI